MTVKNVLKLTILDQITGSPTGQFVYVDSAQILTVLELLTGVSTACIQVTLKHDSMGVSNLRFTGPATRVINFCLEEYIQLIITTAIPSPPSIYVRVADIIAIYLSGTGSTIVVLPNGSVDCSDSIESITAAMIGEIIDV